jgi:hypothetical protein
MDAALVLPPEYAWLVGCAALGWAYCVMLPTVLGIAGGYSGMPGAGAGVFYAPFCRRAFSLRKLRRIKKGGVDELGKLRWRF